MMMKSTSIGLVLCVLASCAAPRRATPRPQLEAVDLNFSFSMEVPGWHSMVNAMQENGRALMALADTPELSDASRELPTTAAPRPASFRRGEPARPAEAAGPPAVLPPVRARRKLAILVKGKYVIVIDTPRKP